MDINPQPFLKLKHLLQNNIVAVHRVFKHATLLRFPKRHCKGTDVIQEPRCLMLCHTQLSLNLRVCQRFVHHGSEHCPSNGEHEGGSSRPQTVFWMRFTGEQARSWYRLFFN
jgi:hypothetical protein